MIPQQQIEHIKERAKDDIVSIIGLFVKLEGVQNRYKKSYKGICPFHKEKTPSFTVFEDSGRYKCFGCGESGDAVTMVMKEEGLDFIEAIRWLADELNIIIHEEKGNAPSNYVPPKALIPGIKDAKKHIRKEGTAVLCFSKGMRNKLYSQGLKNVLYCPRYRPGQVELIAKYTNEVIIIPRGLNQRKFFKALEITHSYEPDKFGARLSKKVAKDEKSTPLWWGEFIITHFGRTEEVRKRCIKILAAIPGGVTRSIETTSFNHFWDKSELQH